jgi:hypothetical protein
VWVEVTVVCGGLIKHRIMPNMGHGHSLEKVKYSTSWDFSVFSSFFLHFWSQLVEHIKANQVI